MKKCFLFIFLMAAMLLFATTDRVYLKNGKILEGSVKQYEVGKFVEIETKEGRIQIINWEQVESLDLEQTMGEVKTAPDDPEKQKQEETNEPGIQEITPPAKLEEPDIAVPGNQVKEQAMPNDLKVKVGKKGVSLEQTLDTEQLRVNWQSQGGSLLGKELTVNMLMTKMDFSDSLSGKTKLNGLGYGYAGNINFLQFSPPNYAEQKFYSYAFKIGISGAFSVNFMNFKNEIYLPEYSISTKNELTMGAFEAGLNVGANFGLGHFFNPQKWGGIILGLGWRPTWQYTMTNTTTETNMTTSNNSFNYSSTSTSSADNSQFSWSAVEATLDIGGIKAMTDKMTKRAHFRLNMIYVPPVGDYKLSMLYLGLGVVWYK